MNKYICFYNERRIEVLAKTSYLAQQAAGRLLKVKQGWKISVMLAEKDGKEVIHGTEEL